MIECVEEFSPELPGKTFGHAKHLEQAQIGSLNPRTVECARSARAECSSGRECKRRRIDKEACAGVAGRVAGSARKGIAYAIWVRSVVRAGEAHVRRRHAEGRSSLQSDDSVELPSAEQIARQVVARYESLPSADGQIPGEVADKAMANVKRRVAHFGAVVVCIGRCGASG